MATKKRISIRLNFGPLAPSIDEQLREQGVKMPGDAWDRRVRQKIADAIALLNVQGCLTDTEKSKAYRRLMKRIATDAAKKETKQ